MKDPVKVFIGKSEYQEELDFARQTNTNLDGALNHLCHCETENKYSDATPFLLRVVDESCQVEATYYVPATKQSGD